MASQAPLAAAAAKKAQRNSADRLRRAAKDEAFSAGLRARAERVPSPARASDGRAEAAADDDAEDKEAGGSPGWQDWELDEEGLPVMTEAEKLMDRARTAEDCRDAFGCDASAAAPRKRKAPGDLVVGRLKQGLAESRSAADAAADLASDDDVARRMKTAAADASRQLWAAGEVARRMDAVATPSAAQDAILLRLTAAAEACDAARAELGIGGRLRASNFGFAMTKGSAEALLLRAKTTTRDLSHWAMAGGAVAE